MTHSRTNLPALIRAESFPAFRLVRRYKRASLAIPEGFEWGETEIFHDRADRADGDFTSLASLGNNASSWHHFTGMTHFQINRSLQIRGRSCQAFHLVLQRQLVSNEADGRLWIGRTVIFSNTANTANGVLPVSASLGNYWSVDTNS